MEVLRSILPGRPSVATLTRSRQNTRATSSAAPAVSSAVSSTHPDAEEGGSRANALLREWKQLDENLASFERLEAMRTLVARGELSSGAYGMLHELAVTRATGRPQRRPSALVVMRLEPPIMAGQLYLRVGRAWRKRYVLLFTERLEYHLSKHESEASRGKTTSGPSDLLVLTDKFFVSDSTSRRLANPKEHGFMVSDFATTHYFAADSRDLAQYWMLIIAKTIRKIREAKAFFDQRPKIIGRPVPKSSTVLEQEYQERLLNYRQTERQASSSRRMASSGAASGADRRVLQMQAAEEGGGRIRQSVRLKMEAAELENRMQEHAAMQIEFEEEAAKAQEQVEKLQHEVESAQADERARQAKERELNDATERRVELEERALLEAKMVLDYEELVQEKQTDAAEAEAAEQVSMEFKRRSVALLPSGAGPEELERLTKLAESTPPDQQSPETLEVKHSAIEAVIQKTEEEHGNKVQEAEAALAQAREAAKRAQAIARAAPSTKQVESAFAQVHEAQAAEEAAKRAAHERDLALKKAEALYRQLNASRAVLERSKQQAAARMGQAAKKPVPSEQNAPQKRPTVVHQQPVAHQEDPKVQAQIERIVEIIRRLGGPSLQVEFGTLRKEFEKEVAGALSEALNSGSSEESSPAIFDIVGLLARAKHQSAVDYDGDNLFQDKDGHILVRIPRPAATN